ncbi:MAG: RNA polymerase subunit sigma-24, partial [Chthoniobacteraceae bacterium]|nr:RNA polymerase subunit sigma-24 [Chthoniobacteraceae bacterium]
ALVLQRFEALSYEEIATLLDVSVPAVKSLLFRARTTLRELLKDYLNE